MINESIVTGHYKKTGLYSRIIDGLKQDGIKHPTARDLSLVDEFHIGGVDATKLVSQALAPDSSEMLLDIGCGIGGPARFIAAGTGCHVTGIDLTRSFVKTGNLLSQLVAMDSKVKLQAGNATALTFPDSNFDAAYMIHVGMNITKKDQLIGEAARVIKSGGRFIIYDVMRIQDGALTYPLPWAENERASAVSSPSIYLEALEKAGFVSTPPQDKSGFALQFFDRFAKKRAKSHPPALSPHLIMGKTTQLKIQNIYQQIKHGVLAPVVITSLRK